MVSRWMGVARRLPFLRRSVTARCAREHLVTGDIDAARGLLEAAVAENPEWAEPWYLLGRCAAQEGLRDHEEAAYLEAISRDRGHRAAQDALLRLRAWRHRPVMDGWQLYFAGQSAAALEAFERGRARAGGSAAAALEAEIRSGIGWSLFELGRYAEARAAFNAAIKADPRLVHAQKGLGLVLYRLAEYDAAEAALRSALALQKDLFDAQAFLGWCAYARGEWATALDRFGQASRMNPLDADSTWGIAWSLVRLHRPADAAPVFEEAIHKGASHPSVHDAILLFANDAAFRAHLRDLANRLLREGAGLAAFDAFSRLAQVEPGVEASVGCARSLLAAGRPEGVPGVFSSLDPALLDTVVEEEVVADESSDHVRREVTPRVLLGRAALLRRAFADAAAILGVAAARSPSVAPARLHLAEARTRLGELDAAEDGFRSLVDDRGCAAAARAGLAEVAHKRREMLLDALERLVTHDNQGALEALLAMPSFGAGEAWRAKLVEGRALAEMGRDAEARAAFAEARAFVEEQSKTPATAGSPSAELVDEAAARPRQEPLNGA